MMIPSETWASLANYGVRAFLFRKMRESVSGGDEGYSGNAGIFGTSYLSGSLSYSPGFNNISAFVLLSSYQSSQSNYLINPAITNSFAGWISDGAGGSGLQGDASNIGGGFGVFGTSESSPFGSVSSFGQDVADKIGAVVGGLIGVGFKGGIGLAFGGVPGLAGLAVSLAVEAALDKAMPTSSWGTWGYLADKISDLLGWGSSASESTGYDGQVGYGSTGYGSGYGMDVGIGRDASLSGVSSAEAEAEGMGGGPGDSGDSGGSSDGGGGVGADSGGGP